MYATPMLPGPIFYDKNVNICLSKVTYKNTIFHVDYSFRVNYNRREKINAAFSFFENKQFCLLVCVPYCRRKV